jgi:hypothetical protein
VRQTHCKFVECEFEACNFSLMKVQSNAKPWG